MKSKRIRIVVVDDHHLVRAGIAALLATEDGIDVVGEAADGAEALAKVQALLPDIVLLDISMPTMNGVDATRQIRQLSPTTKVLILTQHEGEEYVNQAVRAGATGYLPKDSLAQDLVRAIREIHAGKEFWAPSISRVMVETFVRQAAGDGGQKSKILTNREREILRLIAEGNSNQKIAEKLFISVRTVEFHRANLTEKLNIHDTAGLVKYALQHKLIRLE